MLKYPNQMWLDGLYMAGPICAEYGARFGEPQLWTECSPAGEAVKRCCIFTTVKPASSLNS